MRPLLLLLRVDLTVDGDDEISLPNAILHIWNSSWHRNRNVDKKRAVLLLEDEIREDDKARRDVEDNILCCRQLRYGRSSRESQQELFVN
mmetsp:Transcript_7488/g.10720  ORF Transcript_7488/g.10720 Transcript_7488/m.10720 type:complete len:90 (-) Transcript_7488:92-361(-)